jgi:predicted dehydrogenase
MKTLRFGIIGSGFMGRTHIEALKRLPDVAAVAVAGGKRAPGLAQRYGIEFVAVKEDLLRRADIDAIVITTPHHLHVDEALEAIARGAAIARARLRWLSRAHRLTGPDCSLLERFNGLGF